MNPLEQLRLVNDAIARHHDHQTAEALRQTERDERQRTDALRDAARLHEALTAEAPERVTVVDPATLERIREAGRVPLATETAALEKPISEMTDKELRALIARERGEA